MTDPDPGPYPTTLVEALQRAARFAPESTAFVYLKDGEVESDRLTLADWERQARAIAARLQSMLSPGETVILLYGDGLEFIPALYGCIYAGVIAVPMMPPKPNQPAEAFTNVLANSKAKVALTTERSLATLREQYEGSAFLETLTWLTTDDSKTWGNEDRWIDLHAKPDDVAVLLYTSGSTSLPKGVMLTHKSIMGKPFEVPPGVDPTMKTSTVSWMPFYHIAGLMGITSRPILLGSVIAYIQPAEAVMERPIRWLQAISRYKAISCGAPNFMYQLCVDRIKPEEREGLDLSMWFFASFVAEPIRAETIEQFTETYAPYGFQRWALLPGYGLSESSQGVSGRSFGAPARITSFGRDGLAQGQVVAVEEGAENSQRLVSSGKPDPKTNLRIVDPATGIACPPHQIGEIWTTSEYLSRGYWERPSETEETFGAHLADTGEGPFLRTGDLGFVYDDELYISGRLKEVIIIRGKKYHAQDIEAAAAGSHPDLGTSGAAFSVPVDGSEQVVLYYEIKPDCETPDVEAISAAIRRAVSKAMQLPLYAVVLVEAGTLPRTSVGKMQRYLCREEFWQLTPLKN